MSDSDSNPSDKSSIGIKTILAPTDFSDRAGKSLKYALSFAKTYGAKLILLHVVEPVSYAGEYGYLSLENQATEASKELEKLKATFSSENLEIECVTRIGRAFKEVTEFADEKIIDLLVISTHGYTGLKHVLMGSVAEQIVRYATCPVLTVRLEEHDFVE